MIENTGSTKTTINDKPVNEIEWNATYNGSIADIDVNMDSRGKKEHISMKLTNDDLKNILNSHNDSELLDKRLMNDFALSKYSNVDFRGNILNKINKKSRAKKSKMKKRKNDTKKKQKTTQKKRRNTRKKRI